MLSVWAQGRQWGQAGAVVFLILADLLVLPWLLWDAEIPYTPLRFAAGVRKGVPEAVGVAGEWFLLHVTVGAAALTWRAKQRERQKAPAGASDYASHGSARFARAGELRTYLKASGPGLVFGALPDGPVTFPPDPMLPYSRNVTVIGSTGRMKTRAFVQPNLLQEPLHKQSSIICMDPKGENYARSSRLLRQAGYDLRLFNLLDMAHSDRWNPLQAVGSTTDAADLATNLVANTVNPNRPRTGDPFWDQAEQSFITALVLYAKQHCPAAEQHMASVLELGAELHPNALDFLFLALPREAPARRFYRTFLRADEKVRAGVVAGLGSRLQLWNVPEIAAVTATSDFDLGDLGKRHMALFLVIPDSKPTYAPILALFWQQVFQVLYDVADKHGGALPVPVRCVMDEIANCGYIPDYAQKKSTMRSRRISTEEIWQNLSQLKNRYSYTWAELLANSDHLLFLGANDLETAKYISELTGTTTISVAGTGSTEGTTGGSTSSSMTYLGRPLLTPDECLRLPNTQALLFPRSHYPARITKVDFTAHALAGEIQLDDHKEYPAPEREPVVVTDVHALVEPLLPKRKENEAKETAEGPSADPSQFVDQEPGTDKSEAQEEGSE